MPELLTEDGLQRLNVFKNLLIQGRQGDRQIGLIADEILKNNDVDYWNKNKEKLSTIFINSGIPFDGEGNEITDDLERFTRYYNSYTPNCDTYSKLVFDLHFDFLTDLKKNWTDYVPRLTRALLWVFKIEERIEYALKFMTIERDLYDRRQLTKGGSNYDVVCQSIENDRVRYNQLLSALDHEKTIQKRTEEKKVKFDGMIENLDSKLFNTVKTLPNIVEELPQKKFNDINEYFQQYRYLQNRPSTARSCLSFAEGLVKLEIDLNKHLLNINHEPKYNYITILTREELNLEKINEFETLVNGYCQHLASQLKDYIKSDDGDPEKIKLAKVLADLLAHLKPADSVTKCTQMRFHLQNMQLFHLSLLLNKNLSAGRFGEILDLAFEAFKKLEKEISLENCKTLAELVETNLDIIEESKPAVGFSK